MIRARLANVINGFLHDGAAIAMLGTCLERTSMHISSRPG